MASEQSKADAVDQEQLERLPLLEPGQVVKREDVGQGFRLRDGYALTYNGRGDIKVSQAREENFNTDKIHSIVMQYPSGVA